MQDNFVILVLGFIIVFLLVFCLWREYSLTVENKSSENTCLSNIDFTESGKIKCAKCGAIFYQVGEEVK